MNIQFFICFHKEVIEKIYKVSREQLNKYITFYGVKNRIENENVIYESELSEYNPRLQENKYNEGSCLYHIYKNRLYEKYDYIGFCQYDMVFYENVFDDIENTIAKNENTIFYLGFFEWAFLGGQTAILRDYEGIDAGLKSYNEFFKTDYTPFQLLDNRMIICNTFLIPQKMYSKMMSWLITYFKDDIMPSFYDGENNIRFNPGHIIEALTSMFLALEICQGADYHKLNISHNEEYKI